MNSLDLHGIRQSEVQVILDQCIVENMKSNQKVVSIVTGQSDQMKNIVINCVSDYNMTCEEEYLNPGKFIIKLV